MAAHEKNQGASNVPGKEGHRDRGHNSPHKQRMPFPLPDLAKQPPGMMAEMFDLASAEGKAAGVEEMHAQFDKWNKQKQVERRHGVGADLRCDLIETEGPGEHHDQDGCDADRRVDADDDAQGETPRQTARRRAAAKLAEQGAEHPAAEELANRLGHKHMEWDGVGDCLVVGSSRRIFRGGRGTA